MRKAGSCRWRRNKIHFAPRAQGQIIGVGNGDPSCHEPDTFVPNVTVKVVGQASAAPWARSLFNGLAQVIVQSTKDAGEIKLTAVADGLAPATSAVQTQPCAPRPSAP